MRVKKTKALRYVVATFLTMGTVISLGFLAFSGLWSISTCLLPAILAFFLSGVVEGKVFGTGIFKGLARLKLLGRNGKKHLLFSELNKFLSTKDENWITNQCNFVQDYYNQRKKYKTLKADHSAKEEDIKEAGQRLKELKDYFYQQIHIPNNPNIENSYISQAIKDPSLIELNSAKRSVWFLRFFWIISILVGIVSGIATAFAVHNFIDTVILVKLGLSLSAIATSAIVLPIVIFAAIGATFLFYYAITHIVKNDAKKAFSKTLELFKRKMLENNTKESLSQYCLRLLSLSIAVIVIAGITLFATVAAATTNWANMKTGIIKLAPKLPIFVVYCSNAILIPINFVADLIFGLSTTLQTIDNCKGIAKNIFKKFIKLLKGIYEIIKHPLKTIKNFSNIKMALYNLKEKRNESWGQLFNPFRILAMFIILPLQFLVFIGHLISVGLTTDRMNNVPPALVAGICATSEGLQDLSFFTKEDDHNHNHEQDHDAHDGHDHGNLLQLPLQVLLSLILITAAILYWAVKKFGNEVSFFDAIEQTFELPLLNIIFFPLLLPSAIWHWMFKKSEDNLTFLESIKKSFDIHTHHYKTPDQPETPKDLSAEWREIERPQWMLNAAKNRLNSAKIDNPTALEKQNCLEELSSKEGLKYVTNKLNNGENIDEVLSEYTAGTAKKLERSKPLTNGYSNGHINVPASETQFISFSSILNKQRTFFTPTLTKTTTSKNVYEAFRLVRATG